MNGQTPQMTEYKKGQIETTGLATTKEDEYFPTKQTIKNQAKNKLLNDTNFKAG